jgi:hypothetical protein
MLSRVKGSPGLSLKSKSVQLRDDLGTDFGPTELKRKSF